MGVLGDASVSRWRFHVGCGVFFLLEIFFFFVLVDVSWSRNGKNRRYYGGQWLN